MNNKENKMKIFSFYKNMFLRIGKILMKNQNQKLKSKKKKQKPHANKKFQKKVPFIFMYF